MVVIQTPKISNSNLLSQYSILNYHLINDVASCSSYSLCVGKHILLGSTQSSREQFRTNQGITSSLRVRIQRQVLVYSNDDFHQQAGG